MLDFKLHSMRKEFEARRANTPAELSHKKARDDLLKIFGNYGVADDILNAIELGLINGIKTTYTVDLSVQKRVV